MQGACGCHRVFGAELAGSKAPVRAQLVLSGVCHLIYYHGIGRKLVITPMCGMPGNLTHGPASCGMCSSCICTIPVCVIRVCCDVT